MDFDVARADNAFALQFAPLIHEGLMQGHKLELFAENDSHPIGMNDFVVFAHVPGDTDNVIGIITYGYTNKRDSLTLTFCYVDPAHRMNAVMNEMLAEVYEHCQKLKIGFLNITVPKGATDLNDAFQHLDFEVAKQLYVKRVE